MHRPTVYTLHESGHYRLVESFSIDEMAQFLVREAGVSTYTTSDAKVKKKPGLLLTLLLAGAGAGFGYLIGSAFVADTASERLLAPGWQLLLAFLAFLIVWLPLHEAIHALFFKLSLIHI